MYVQGKNYEKNACEKLRKKVSKNEKKHVRNEAGKRPENEVATRNFHPSSVSLATLIPSREGNEKRGHKTSNSRSLEGRNPA